jgi:hypothetical protein
MTHPSRPLTPSAGSTTSPNGLNWARATATAAARPDRIQSCADDTRPPGSGTPPASHPRASCWQHGGRGAREHRVPPRSELLCPGRNRAGAARPAIPGATCGSGRDEVVEAGDLRHGRGSGVTGRTCSSPRPCTVCGQSCSGRQHLCHRALAWREVAQPTCADGCWGATTSCCDSHSRSVGDSLARLLRVRASTSPRIASRRR